ncbi:tap measure protein [Bacillus phage Belinda]|uniref:tail associated lysin n=1 Tax=Bacillus phage Belinda TaxID=1852564 RepID=UPI0007F09CF4|nr:tail associated lysin [Bacillus phage Belinda]ANM46030.1 tap measure protein [Bacillus phage Belinda]
MAKREKYIFDVEAEVGKAAKSIKSLEAELSKLQKLNKDIDATGGDRTEKEMLATLKAAKEVNAEYQKMQRILKDLSKYSGKVSRKEFNDSKVINNAKTSVQGGKVTDSFGQMLKNMERQINSVNKQFDNHRKAMVDRGQQYTEHLKTNRKDAQGNSKASMMGRNKSTAEDMEKAVDKFLTGQNEATNGLNQALMQLKEISKLNRRSESLSRRASASGYMSFQQYSNFTGDRRTVQQTYGGLKTENRARVLELSGQATGISKELDRLNSKKGLTAREGEERKKLMRQLEGIDAELTARKKLNNSLDETTANMDRFNQSLLDANVSVKPERGTVRGMMYERAPAIALAIGGAITATIGKLYGDGGNHSKAMRPDETYVGQQTGAVGANWRPYRTQTMRSGLGKHLGFTGQEMMEFQSNYLSANGYHGAEDMKAATTGQATFARATGLGADDVKDFFNTAYRSGGVDGNQTKQFQNAFLGAMKQSGAVGREKDQLKALNGILSSMSQNRTVTNQEMMRTMGLQSTISATGVSSLQGTKGGALMEQLDNGIREGFNDPQMRVLFGQGTKYQGMKGRAQLRKQMEKGISDPDNLSTLIEAAKAQAPSGDKEEQAEVLATLASRMGVNMSSQQAGGLLGMDPKSLTKENIDKVMKEGLKEGSIESAKRDKAYSESKASIDNASEAATAKQATELNDMGSKLREANVALGGLPAPMYAAIAAVVAFTAAVAGSAAMFGGASLLKRGAASRYGGRGRGGRGGGGGGGGVGAAATGAGAAGAAGAGAAAAEGAAGVAAAGGVAGTAAGAAAGGSKFAGVGKGLMKGAGKLMLPLGILMGASEIMQAPEEQKGAAVGSAVGGLGGGVLGGAAAGAAFGSFLGPIGTAVGGIGGAIAGGWAGSGIGETIGGWFDSKPKGDAAASASAVAAAAGTTGAVGSSALQAQMSQGITGAPNMSQVNSMASALGISSGALASQLGISSGQENQIQTMTDKENTNTKKANEAKKGDNLSYERENISMYERVLTRAEQILAQARAQNGIMGVGGGGTAGAGGGINGFTGGGKLQFLADGQKWTSSNLQQHDLGFTDQNLTAEDLDNWINSKAPKDSMMRGMGATFLKAGQEYGLDPRYLIAHAAEESGWGTSKIARDKGNFFGIGAFDDSPYSSAFEFKDGTGSAAEKGIMGGAKWISEKYYGKGRTTLDKMKAAGYATNATWAPNIASIMAGAPKGSGSGNVTATINVNVKGDDKVSDKLKNSADMKKAGKDIGSLLGFYSREMTIA